MKTPTTIEEWQNVVNLADMLLGIDSARQYGLIQGGSATNIIRCQKLIKDGAEQDVKPNWSNDHLAAFIGELVHEETDQLSERSSARDVTAYIRADRARIREEREARRKAREDGAPEDPSDDADTPPEGSPTPEDSQDAG